MRDHILQVAENLFYADGIRAVGVDRLIAEAGIAKASLYRHFASKDELVEAYLRGRHDRVVAALSQALAAPEVPARERVLLIFDLLAEKAGQPLFRGCAFLIAVAEQESSEPVLKVAREHKTTIRSLLLGVLRELPLADPDAVAAQIALCYEGALATFAVHRDPHAAHTGRRCAEVLLDAALTAAH
jgi:AcrR family transcriptional regulator